MTSIPFEAVRLWEQDAAAAVASALPGLAAIGPLMAGANADLVEQAVGVMLAQEPAGRRQADLLSILGVFAEPLMERERFVRLVGRERLMASDLIDYLMSERIAELEQAHAAQLEQEQAADVAARMVEDALIARFPATPVALAFMGRWFRRHGLW